MQRHHQHTSFCARGWSVLALAATVALLSGCGDKITSVRFKVNSEPEGAYVVYQMSGTKTPCAGEWIYLGNTPLQGVHQFSREQLENSDKITLKVMQPGYVDQKKDWDGDSFYEEAEEKGVIYWTPEMIPSGSQQ